MEYRNSKNKKFIEYFVQSETENGTLPYVLLILENLEEGKELVVESLNFEGTNIIDTIMPHAIEQLKVLAEIVEDAPILIPFTPDVRGGIPYYQQLSRECFQETENGEYNIDYPRIDLQILNTINNAKVKIKEETKRKLQDKIFLSGYSSSGVFAQRFALIHPEIVSRVLIGGASGSIPLPTEDFDYPLGIKDYRDLFEKDFDENEYKKIQFAYYVGELEAKDISSERNKPMHDMSYHPRSINKKMGEYQRQKLGEDLSQRHENCLKYYENNSYNITSKIYKGAEHRGIFSKNNPSFESLKNDIIAYYKEGKAFSKDNSSVESIDMESQRKRTESKNLFNNMLLNIYKKIKLRRSNIDKAYDTISQTKQNMQTLNNQKKKDR